MSSESFGMQAINLAGGEDAQESRNILGMMDRMTQSGGDVVKGVDNARFNQAIQKGDEYLQQMADELDVPPQVRDQMKFFTGSPDATKAGANYLMKWAEAEKAKKDFEYGMSLPGEFNKQFQEYSSKQFMGLGEGASKEDRDALTQRLKDEREFGLQNLKSQAKTEGEISGIERVLGQGGKDDSLARARLAYQNRMADLAERRAVESEKKGEFDRGEGFQLKKDKYDDKKADEGLKIARLSDKDGAVEIMANTESLIGSIEDSITAYTKDGKSVDLAGLPGFNPFSSTDFLAANNPIRRGLTELGIADEEYSNKSANLRSAIGRYLDQYKKFISGTAVSDDEYKKLLNNLGAGEYNTFPQFINALKNMVDKDLMIYDRRWKIGDTRSKGILSEQYSDFNITGSMQEFSDFLSSLEAKLDKSSTEPMSPDEIKSWINQWGLNKFFTNAEKNKMKADSSKKIDTATDKVYGSDEGLSQKDFMPSEIQIGGQGMFPAVEISLE